ncbi:MAG: hypothetical protein KJO41_11515 [Bacteroidia bacterium]|nr:hypothetical protein [Bacteroidia bacterium]NND25325.1 hypothetical protein [Flavobacteriaceae bacterium]MBT8279625.1 hypothetical protein [Bacteroidia bacterium]NNK59275.1 hypothetical protein [Flavobacteriaceae bacterium]NNL32259.1 hypothetical protein [Flavobacteriaceae bacterium]
MKLVTKYANHIPYLYFIAVIAFLFTDTNRKEGLLAFPILLFGIPFLWQLIKPNPKLNFGLGITFVCLSSYLILAYLSDVFQIFSFGEGIQRFAFLGGIFFIANFIMSLWIIRNSLNRAL